MSADLETLDSIARALEAFGEAPPALLDARLLQQRVDRKFRLHVNTLERLLDHLIEGHRAVRSGSTLAAGYRTRYFDTPDRRSYHDHRRDRRPRYKVRIRHHLDRGLSFLEIKRKGGDGRTTKARRPYPFECEALDDEALRFIDRYCPFGAASLVHGPLIEFRRATLVGEVIDERITLDWGLSVTDDVRCEELPHVAIAEVKQGRYSNATPAVRALRTLHVRERSVSKYCVASAKLSPVPANVFRPVLRAMEQLSA
jgi:hypothetical protein